MSNKNNTPTRSNRGTLRVATGCMQNTPNTKSPVFRRAVLSRTQLAEQNVDEVMNTAFAKSTVGETPNKNTPGRRQGGIKMKSTALNACYTPSSLYRNAIKSAATNTRTFHNTPQTKRISSKVIATPASDVEDRSTEVSNLKVAVRVRPFNAKECMRPAVVNVVHVKGNELTVVAGTTADSFSGVTHSFSYDHVFYSCDRESSQFADQEAVFDSTAQPLIDRAFEGYNGCLFAYGQTGSGKSYSMMGIETTDDHTSNSNEPHSEAGIIPRFCYELFRRIEAMKNELQAEIEVSYFEIYNEKIHDLLCVELLEPSNFASGSANTPMKRPRLKVREHPIWGPYVVDLSVHPVDSYEALRNWLAVGQSQRATAATGMNEKSSRSHSIFNIVLNLTAKCDTSSGDDTLISGQTRRSKISLVDLAGSERINNSDTSGDRIREGVSINKSLLTLGKVIAALSETRRNATSTFVPYRESVLTWLLRENLGGNSKTVMLATISPASVHVEETLATLRYACQARTIVNRVKVNESPHDKIIRELRAEVDRLKSLQNEYERQRRLSLANSNPTPRKIIIETSVDETEVEALRQQLSERQRELDRAQKSWMERLKEADNLRKSEMRLLRRKGLAMELMAEQKQACLVNLTADPILSGTLFYILPPGAVTIGRTRTSTYCTQPDIVLDGPLVAYHHCVIENENGKLFVTPKNKDFETYLNGELVQSQQQMFHGDRLVIGGSHYFRISNPFCTQRCPSKVVDFQLAHQEILHKQEQKLRRDLEEEKQAALSRIEQERVENERTFKDNLQKLELEQLKFKCNSEILDTERKALEEEVASIRTESSDLSATCTPSVHSSLLEDINRIMHNPSEESLHKTQLMVKEATQRCRTFGVDVEFRHAKVMDEFGMFRTVVLILDKAHERKAEWPIARLCVWLDIIRDSENLNAENMFNCVDIKWEPMESDSNETFGDTLNSSRISLNLSIVKDVIIKNAKQNFFGSPCFNTSKSHRTPLASPLRLATKKMLTYEDKISVMDFTKSPPNGEETFINAASQHVRDMQRSSLRLKKLCQRHESDTENMVPNSLNEKLFRDNLERVENLLHSMRSCLDQSIIGNTNDISPSKTPKSQPVGDKQGMA